jgi:phage gp46-like protein
MDAWIDPAVGDYSLLSGVAQRDVAGGLANSIYLRLTVPVGSYWGDATFGSRLGQLQRSKDLTRIGVQAVQYAQQALQPILDDGRLTSINVTSTQPGNGQLYLLIEAYAASGERLLFKHPVQVI